MSCEKSSSRKEEKNKDLHECVTVLDTCILTFARYLLYEFAPYFHALIHCTRSRNHEARKKKDRTLIRMGIARRIIVLRSASLVFACTRKKFHSCRTGHGAATVTENVLPSPPTCLMDDSCRHVRHNGHTVVRYVVQTPARPVTLSHADVHVREVC